MCGVVCWGKGSLEYFSCLVLLKNGETGETAIIGQRGAYNGTFVRQSPVSQDAVIGTLIQGATAGAGCRLVSKKANVPL